MSTSSDTDTTTVITHIDRSYHKVTATTDQMEAIDHYTANDRGERVGGHRARRTASPEFTLLLTNGMGEESEHKAYIVAVASSDSGSVGPSQPVAIAAVEIDGQEWYVMISRKMAWDPFLHIEDNLVAIEGFPEGLLQQADAFMQS